MPTPTDDAGQTPREPLRVVSARDALAKELRDNILNGSYAPGARMSEDEIAKRYGVARPTVRQAIQDLTFEGLLRRRPNHSATVPELNADDVQEIFEARALIEVQCIALLTASQHVPEAMNAHVETLEVLAPDDWASAIEHDQNFHASMVDAVGNSRVSRMYAHVQAENRLCLAQLRFDYGSVREVAFEHRSLMRAIKSGNVAEAEKMLEAHLADALARLLSRSGWAPSVEDEESRSRLYRLSPDAVLGSSIGAGDGEELPM